MKYYIVDAFSDHLFGGNQAGVCVLDAPIDAGLMQNIAIENNFSETAFLVNKGPGDYDLRWFTPGGEIDFCGHATMGSAFVVKHFLEPDLDQVHFSAMCGDLFVRYEGDLQVMNAPRWTGEPKAVGADWEERLGIKILDCFKTRDTVLVTDDVEKIRAMHPAGDLITEIDPEWCVIVTAPAAGSKEDCDFVCRVFCLPDSIYEDPVTGSAHSTLIPYWAEKMGKTHLVSHQISRRGGVLICDDLKEDDRVEMAGKCVCYLQGELQL